MSDRPTLVDELRGLLEDSYWAPGDGVLVPDSFVISRGNPPEVIRRSAHRIAELEADNERLRISNEGHEKGLQHLRDMGVLPNNDGGTDE